MENIKLFCMIYELKGLVNALSELAETHDEYHNPIIDNIEQKLKEIVQHIETKGA